MGLMRTSDRVCFSLRRFDLIIFANQSKQACIFLLLLFSFYLAKYPTTSDSETNEDEQSLSSPAPNQPRSRVRNPPTQETCDRDRRSSGSKSSSSSKSQKHKHSCCGSVSSDNEASQLPVTFHQNKENQRHAPASAL